MIDTSNWDYFYKRIPEPGRYNEYADTNMMYTPLVSPNKEVMCMHWTYFSEYQRYKERPLFNQELLNYFFRKEVQYLRQFQGYMFTPKLLEVDYDQKKLFIEWSGETCNDIIYDSSRSIDNELPNWQEQLSNIVETIYNEHVYKLSLYPHCFFIKDGVLKTFDWYACFPKDDPMVSFEFLKGMMGEKSSPRFDEARSGDNIDFSIFFERALAEHVKWPHEPFPKLYSKLYGL